MAGLRGFGWTRGCSIFPFRSGRVLSRAPRQGLTQNSGHDEATAARSQHKRARTESASSGIVSHIFISQ